MIRTILLVVSLLLFSQAYAFNLGLTNNTPYVLTFKINSVCVPELGLLSPHENKTIPEGVMKTLCEPDDACLIDAYINNCEGTYISGVSFTERLSLILIDNGNTNIFTYAGTYPNKLGLLYLQF